MSVKVTGRVHELRGKERRSRLVKTTVIRYNGKRSGFNPNDLCALNRKPEDGGWFPSAKTPENNMQLHASSK